MNNDRADLAIAIALPGFNNLGRSVIPTFLSVDHFSIHFFLSLVQK